MEISGVNIDSAITSADVRGSFQKIYFNGTAASEWEKLSEIFLTKSVQGTVRGMHLQWGTCSANKFVKCIEGKILDILIDLRVKSPTFCKTIKIELNGADDKVITIPHGVAHGYQVLSEEAIVIYGTDQDWCVKCDIGVHPESLFGGWPLSPMILSDRDTLLPSLEDFISSTSLTFGVSH
jgi:dTDP-4-dehydrorhamnose 3,5-epimerase